MGEEIFREIWDNAYSIYAETDDIQLWDYLKEQIKNGNIDRDTAEDIREDVINTYNL